MTTIYSIIKYSKLLSPKTGEPVKSYNQAKKIIKSWGCERMDNEYLVPENKIAQWNQAVRVIHNL